MRFSLLAAVLRVNYFKAASSWLTGRVWRVLLTRLQWYHSTGVPPGGAGDGGPAGQGRVRAGRAGLGGHTAATLLPVL